MGKAGGRSARSQRVAHVRLTMRHWCVASHARIIAVFPILADVVEVKTGSQSTAHWRIHFIRLNGWLRHSFAQLITLLDIDGIGQNWEDSNNWKYYRYFHFSYQICLFSGLFLWRSAFVHSLNQTVMLIREMVIGKTAEMYEELFACYFRTAAANGLAAPRAAGGAAAEAKARPGRVRFVSATMDFETAQNLGLFTWLARVSGGESTDYHGRAIACGVHFKWCLLKPCGNNLRDPFFTIMVYLGDTHDKRCVGDVRQELSILAANYKDEGNARKANIIQWLLTNHAALIAAFPRCTGKLDRFELLASHNGTKSCECLNRQTKQDVAAKDVSMLLEIVSAFLTSTTARWLA